MGSNGHVNRLKTIGHMMMHDPVLKAEVRDAQWSDFGRTVSKNIFNPDFLEVLTRAGLKSKSTSEMLGYIRAFILTGAKP